MQTRLGSAESEEGWVQTETRPGYSPAITYTYAWTSCPFDKCLCVHRAYAYLDICLHAQPCPRACTHTMFKSTCSNLHAHTSCAEAHVATCMHTGHVNTKIIPRVGLSMVTWVGVAVTHGCDKQVQEAVPSDCEFLTSQSPVPD